MNAFVGFLHLGSALVYVIGDNIVGADEAVGRSGWTGRGRLLSVEGAAKQ